MSFLLSHCGLAGRAASADSDHEGLDQLRPLSVVPATENIGFNDIGVAPIYDCYVMDQHWCHTN